MAARQEREAFGTMLTSATRESGDTLRILLTIRADHANLLTTIAGLGDLIRPQTTHFRLKQPADLGEIVREPLRMAGHDNAVEQDNLVLRLSTDLSSRPGDLALAQMALHLAWRDRGRYGGLLAAYAAHGGALGALGQEAERVRRERLSEAECSLLIPVFIRLIRLGELDTSATRRIAARTEFTETQQRLIDRLASDDCGRLLQTGEGRVEIAHEALITQWPTLHQQVRDAAPDVRRLGELTRLTVNWATQPGHKQWLINPADLSDFDRLSRNHATWLSEMERRFIRTGKRRLMIAAAVLIALGLSSLVGLIATASFYVRAEERDRAAQAAEQTAVAFLAQSRAETAPVDALKLILSIWPKDANASIGNPLIAYQAVSAALRMPRVSTIIKGHDGPVFSAAFSADGLRVVTASDDRSARIWNVHIPSGNLLQIACQWLPFVKGKRDDDVLNLAAGIGITALPPIEPCDTYHPPLPRGTIRP